MREQVEKLEDIFPESPFSFRARQMLGQTEDSAHYMQFSEDEILHYIENLPYEDISFARIDHHREMRWGFPEVIFCPEP